MEVSVIGKSQVNIGRINDVCFPNLNAKVFCSVRNNNNSKGSQNSVWPSRSAQGFRLRTSASVQTQAVVSEKASKVTKTNPNNAIKLYVGLPLDTVSSSNTINHARAISAGLKALKLLGVAGVELPVWWGIAENEGPGNYNWTGYLAVVEMVKKLGLEVRVSLCFHASNENKISLPNWVSKIGESDPSIFFTDRNGQLYKDCLTWAVDDLYVFDGKSPMQVYKEFFESFKSTFSDYLGSTITGLTIGLGPDGELRYPSHHHPIKKRSSISGSGEFQCYDKHTLADLKCHAELHGHPLWGLGGPHDAPNDGFFDSSWKTPYGNFFLSWYSTRLLAHGDRVLSLAASTFESSPVELSAKIPLKARSHPSELTAGFYDADGRDGYGPVFEMFRRNMCGAVLCGPDLNSVSGQELLAAQVMGSCGVEMSGENYSDVAAGGFERIKKNLAVGRNEVVRSFTYQRMGAYFFSPEHFPEFARFVRGLNELDRSLDDVAVVGEGSVGLLSVSPKSRFAQISPSGLSSAHERARVSADSFSARRLPEFSGIVDWRGVWSSAPRFVQWSAEVAGRGFSLSLGEADCLWSRLVVLGCFGTESDSASGVSRLGGSVASCGWSAGRVLGLTWRLGTGTGKETAQQVPSSKAKYETCYQKSNFCMVTRVNHLASKCNARCGVVLCTNLDAGKDLSPVVPFCGMVPLYLANKNLTNHFGLVGSQHVIISLEEFTTGYSKLLPVQSIHVFPLMALGFLSFPNSFPELRLFRASAPINHRPMVDNGAGTTSKIPDEQPLTGSIPDGGAFPTANPCYDAYSASTRRRRSSSRTISTFRPTTTPWSSRWGILRRPSRGKVGISEQALLGKEGQANPELLDF
ncbi:beta-amylase [Striga asiatica]|uniref:Beta-amylase n=1 Tax=Striga asiatica TaxID=4170 RepID=A0A5A7PBV3_STRAF|nr:beta-amylase [Striga asiatica]